MSRWGWTTEQACMSYDTLGLPLEVLATSQKEALRRPKFSSSVSVLSTEINDTLHRLPNLSHVEYTLSTDMARTFEPLESKIEEIWKCQSSCWKYVSWHPPFKSFNQVFRLVTANPPPSITSMKLSNVSAYRNTYKKTQTLRSTLRHLDLEIYRPKWGRNAEPKAGAPSSHPPSSSGRSVYHGAQATTTPTTTSTAHIPAHMHGRTTHETPKTEPQSPTSPHLQHLAFSNLLLAPSPIPRNLNNPLRHIALARAQFSSVYVTHHATIIPNPIIRRLAPCAKGLCRDLHIFVWRV